MASSSTNTILCDAHVHIYDCYDIDNFLDYAWQNFYRQAKLLNSHSNFFALLMLTEAKQDKWFLKLKRNDAATKYWSFEQTDEAVSLVARHTNGNKIYIINGRQIVTSENLEVLALATSEILADGKPVSTVIDWAMANDAIPVIPWGFGKWWGKRGEILSRTLDQFSADTVFLGDNSGRPWFLGKPKHFNMADNQHRRILPGSDPLPFASEYWRPGSVGFYFSETFDKDYPARCISNHLINPNTTITNYMHTERLLPFLRNQFAMQIKKRI